MEECEYLDLTKYPSFTSTGSTTAPPPILGLFFAASWCDDCWTFTPRLEKLVAFDQSSSSSSSSSPLLEIVYISSDRSEQDMQQYKPAIFSEIPFTNQDEIINLKRRFGTCAKKEMDQVGITIHERKYGTPTLILIERATGRVLFPSSTTTDDDGDAAATKHVQRISLEEDDDENPEKQQTETTSSSMTPEQVLELWKSMLRK